MIVVDEVVMLFILVSKQEIFAGKKWNLTFKAMILISAKAGENFYQLKQLKINMRQLS